MRDTATVAGIILGFLLVILGISISPGGNLGFFLHAPSALITIGGALCATMVNFTFADLGNMFRVIRWAFRLPPRAPLWLIADFRRLADIARRDGILALENVTSEIRDPFLERGIQLAVDGTDPEVIHAMMRTDLENMVARHERGIRVLRQVGTYAPAFGMIGTLIGLVILVNHLQEGTHVIGPAMGLAIVTTFYGAILAYLVAIPLSDKLVVRNNDEALVREMMIRGVISIQSGDHPRIVEEKLRLYLPPRLRGAAQS